MFGQTIGSENLSNKNWFIHNKERIEQNIA